MKKTFLIERTIKTHMVYFTHNEKFIMVKHIFFEFALDNRM